MGLRSVILLSVILQILTTSSEIPMPLDKVPSEIKPVPAPTDSSSLRKLRDVNCEFSKPLLVTSTSRTLPLPKLSKPANSDLLLDSSILSVSEIGSPTDFITPTVLLSAPTIESLFPVLCSSDPNTLLPLECLVDSPYLPHFADDFKSVSKDSKLESSKLSSLNVATSNLFTESCTPIPLSTTVESNILLTNKPDDSSSILCYVSENTPNTQVLHQSDVPRFDFSPLSSNAISSTEFMLPTELCPPMYPFTIKSTYLPDVVTPAEVSMISNYPDFLNSVFPYPNLGAQTDPSLFDTAISTISSRSIPYLKPITGENYLYNECPSNTLLEIEATRNANNLSPILNEQFSTIPTILPTIFQPTNVLEYSVPIPMDGFVTVIPPKVPILLNLDSIIGQIDSNYPQTKICPQTNPRDYIKSICSSLNTKPIALSETFNEFVTPLALNIDIISPTSNILQNTLESELLDSVHSVPSKTDSSHYIYNSVDPSLVSCSIPSYKKPSESYACYSTPTLVSNDSPINLNLPDVLSPPVQSVSSVLGSTVSSTRLNIKPTKLEKLSKILESHGDTPTVILSFSEPSPSIQSTSLPSIIGTDIYCTKDSILLQTPPLSSPSVSLADKTPPSSVTDATSKVVSSINNIASKIAKSAVTSLSSYVKSMSKINSKSNPPSLNCITSNIVHEPVPSNINSDSSKMSNVPCPTSILSFMSSSPSTSLPIPFEDYSSSPTYLQSPVLPSYSFPSSLPWDVSPLLCTNNSNDLETLLDQVLRSEMLKDDDCIDEEALETIMSLFRKS